MHQEVPRLVLDLPRVGVSEGVQRVAALRARALALGHGHGRDLPGELLGHRSAAVRGALGKRLPGALGPRRGRAVALARGRLRGAAEHALEEGLILRGELLGAAPVEPPQRFAQPLLERDVLVAQLREELDHQRHGLVALALRDQAHEQLTHGVEVASIGRGNGLGGLGARHRIRAQV